MSSPDLQPWRDAHDHWEANPSDATREALHDAERALRDQAEAARGAAESSLQALDAYLAALVEVEEQAAADAELSARHGDLAGASATAEERIAELNAAREEVGAALETLPGPDVLI